MKKRIKKQWIAALMSGEYTQGRGQLRKGNEFCCLGVLCNLHAQAHPEIAAKQTELEQYMGARVRLPEEVLTWAGIDRGTGLYQYQVDKHLNTLAEQNDSGVSFHAIAQIIEERL